MCRVNYERFTYTCKMYVGRPQTYKHILQSVLKTIIYEKLFMSAIYICHKGTNTPAIHVLAKNQTV